jgi:2OG-Fe(II) oxygenase superfamily
MANMSDIKTLQWDEQIFTLDGLVTIEECDELIQKAETRGFRDSAPSGGGHGRTGREDARTSQFCVIDDEEEADRLWQKVKSHLLPDVSHLTTSAYITDATKHAHPIAVNPHLRIYKYEPGQAFPEHIDYKMRQIVWRDGKKYERMTYMTLLIYLNDNFESGETGFWTQHDIMGKKEHCRFLRTVEDKPHQVIISPLKGRMLISDQNLLHEGIPPSSGTKYVLRTDIVHEREMVLHPKVRASMSERDLEDREGEWERIFETSCKNYAD